MSTDTSAKPTRVQDTHFWYLLAGALAAALLDTILDHRFGLAGLVGKTVFLFAIPAIVMFFSRAVWGGWVSLVAVFALAEMGRFMPVVPV